MERFGDQITVERFPASEPASGSCKDILKRKEEVAALYQGRWIIHTDADEIRSSPLLSLNLADALASVEAAGWNRVDFTVLNHRPVNDHSAGSEGLVNRLPFFEFGNKPGHFVQKKLGYRGGQRVEVAQSGGRIVEFPEARDCPYRFVLHHYPLRSPEHAHRKINRERIGRWLREEAERGWHSHYNDFIGLDFIVWSPDQLYDSRPYLLEQHG
jgi:hypothetical protein